MSDHSLKLSTEGQKCIYVDSFAEPHKSKNLLMPNALLLNPAFISCLPGDELSYFLKKVDNFATGHVNPNPKTPSTDPKPCVSKLLIYGS